MASASREALIRQLAQKHGLDPNAVIAIAKVEGQSALYGGNSIGDHGTSFGPFQLHVGGALPKGKGNAWANSPAGLEYAISHMTAAQGLQGKAAVQAISQHFERPADVAGEVAKAWGLYGKQGGGFATLGGPQSAGNVAGRSNPLATDPKAVIVQTLLQASSDAAQGKTPDFGGIMQIAQARQQAQAAQEQYGPEPTMGALAGHPGAGVNGIAQTASQYLGIPYKWGGNDPRTGLDCSSFVQQALGQHGIKVPRTTYDQYKKGQPVSLAGLKPGDAVFTEPGKNGPNHVGLYVGNGMIQESPHTGTVNKLIPVKQFVSGGYVGARRYAS